MKKGKGATAMLLSDLGIFGTDSSILYQVRHDAQAKDAVVESKRFGRLHFGKYLCLQCQLDANPIDRLLLTLFDPYIVLNYLKLLYEINYKL
jgi:hypothetical protein